MLQFLHFIQKFFNLKSRTSDKEYCLSLNKINFCPLIHSFRGHAVCVAEKRFAKKSNLYSTLLYERLTKYYV